MSKDRAITLGKWGFGLLASVLVAWSAMKATVQYHTKQIDDNVQSISSLNTRTRVVEDFCVKQQVHNDWTKETLIRMEKKLDK